MTANRGSTRSIATHFQSERRSVLLGMSATALAVLAAFRKAHGFGGSTATELFRKEQDGDGVEHTRVHEGKGAVGVKFFCDPEEFARPAILLTYALPPGASEGVHTHRPGDRKMGSFDEFYYIVSGSGEMQIAGEKVPVTAGDHVFTPNGVAHGIENTSDADLKVYLVAMRR